MDASQVTQIETRTAHWALLNVGADLVKSAKRAFKGSPEKASWRCAGALALVAAALEACINVYAGIYYTGTEGGRRRASGAGWPDRWLEAGGHRAHTKWQDYAREIAGGSFTHGKQELTDWQNRIIRLYDDRNELVMHFKGTPWARGDLQARWTMLTPRNADELLSFARALVSVFEEGFWGGHRLEREGLLASRGFSVYDEGGIDRATGMTATSDLVAWFFPVAEERGRDVGTGERGEDGTR